MQPIEIGIVYFNLRNKYSLMQRNLVLKIIVFLSRNIEEILALKGEEVKKVTDSAGTTEITLEDIVGTDNITKLTDHSSDEK